MRVCDDDEDDDNDDEYIHLHRSDMNILVWAGAKQRQNATVCIK